MSTRERVLWMLGGAEAALAVVAAWMQTWSASAAMGCCAAAALFSLRSVRKAGSRRANPGDNRADVRPQPGG